MIAAMNQSAPLAIVAGAGAGGVATTASLVRAGFRVVVLDARRESAEAAIAALSADADTGAGVGAVQAHAVDLLDETAVLALRDRLLAEYGRIDAVVHLVGGWRGGRTLTMTSVADWRALQPPIVETLAVLTAAFAPDVAASDVGRVVMVTSTAAATPTAGNIAYAAAKSAAEAWMVGVADHLRDTAAAAVTVAVKALVTDAMIAASPDRDFTTFTHVRDLGDAIAAVCVGPIGNGDRVDLTVAPGSASGSSS